MLSINSFVTISKINTSSAVVASGMAERLPRCRAVRDGHRAVAKRCAHAGAARPRPRWSGGPARLPTGRRSRPVGQLVRLAGAGVPTAQIRHRTEHCRCSRWTAGPKWYRPSRRRHRPNGCLRRRGNRGRPRPRRRRECGRGVHGGEPDRKVRERAPQDNRRPNEHRASQTRTASWLSFCVEVPAWHGVRRSHGRRGEPHDVADRLPRRGTHRHRQDRQSDHPRRGSRRARPATESVRSDGHVSQPTANTSHSHGT